MSDESWPLAIQSGGKRASADQTLNVACALIADTTNGVSSVKVERVALDVALEALVRAVEEHPGVRLVLRSTLTPGQADLVIEQALEPIHFEEPRAPGWLSRLGFLRQRRQQSKPSGTRRRPRTPPPRR